VQGWFQSCLVYHQLEEYEEYTYCLTLKFFPMATALINRDFIRKAAWKENRCRIDGRDPHEFRETSVQFFNKNGFSEIRLGRTHVRSIVTGEVVPPTQDRPNEGRIFFGVEFLADSDAGALIDGPRSSVDSVAICNHVERILRGSKAIDSESLCILGGKCVWSLRCDIQIMHDEGSVSDACSLSALCALLNFKYGAIAYDGDHAVVFPTSAREPVSMSVYHLPISTSFALFESEEGVSWFVDPCMDEEKAFGSILSVTVNQHGELCGINKPGGIPIDSELLSACIQIAVERAKYVSSLVRCSLPNKAQ
jgi:exosome complex component RRP45